MIASKLFPKNHDTATMDNFMYDTNSARGTLLQGICVFFHTTLVAFKTKKIRLLLRFCF